MFCRVCGTIFRGFCASACFFASRAKRLRSASLLPEATRPGFLAVAGFVFGTSEVTRSGVPGATGSSGDGLKWFCLHRVYIRFKKKNPVRFLSDSYQISTRLLSTSSKPSSG